MPARTRFSSIRTTTLLEWSVHKPSDFVAALYFAVFVNSELTTALHAKRAHDDLSAEAGVGAAAHGIDPEPVNAAFASSEVSERGIFDQFLNGCFAVYAEDCICDSDTS